MGRQCDIRRPALAALAAGVAGLYAGALVYPVDRPARDALEWVSLPAAGENAARPLEAAGAAKPSGAATVAELQDAFAVAAFDLKAVRRGNEPVPRLFLAALPRDFAALKRVDRRKTTFFKAVLPLVLRVNEEIRAERRRLVELRELIRSGRPLSGERRAWLVELAQRYESAPDDMAKLLRRVDTVSPALALAQAAEESGWGRSRFARHGNALFGQRVWREGAGIVPHERGDGARFEVRAYPSLLDSVRSYALNLNRHPVYAEFRAKRAAMRASKGRLDAYRLAETLEAYSERGDEYVETLHRILRVNKLEALEGSRLIGAAFETARIDAPPAGP